MLKYRTRFEAAFGPQVGASSYQRAGVIEPWPNQADLGRFDGPASRKTLLFKHRAGGLARGAARRRMT